MTQKLYTSPPFFMGYTTKAGGCLPDTPAAHALFYYYLLARQNYEEIEGGLDVQYDLGQESNRVDYKQLADSIAWLYGVRLWEMIRYWSAVDQQCLQLALPLLPTGERFRFNTPHEIAHKPRLTTT